MPTSPRLNRRSVAQQVRDDLRGRMASGEIASGAQLPSEPECCSVYGVSRATVREAYRLLEQEGLIEVRPGTGRFVLANVQRQIQGSVNVFRSMTDFLVNAGYRPVTTVIGLTTRMPTAEEIDLLELAPTREVVELERLRFSDGAAIVHSLNVFDAQILPVDLDQVDWSGSVVELFRSNDLDAVSSIVDVRAISLPERLVTRFDLPTSVAWLCLSGPAFDKRGRPLWWSQDIVRGDVRTIRIVNRSDPNED